MSKKETPTTWESPKDARQQDGAMKYPNYYSHKTRSGHTVVLDDSEGNESVTIQHRGGSMIQMTPDGAINITSHNGMYNIVFGENRMLVTGAHDVTVQGGGSLKVEGDYNMTVKGNMNQTVDGDINVTAGKGMNILAKDNFDVASSKSAIKTTEGMNIASKDGPVSISGGGGIGITSEKNMAMYVKGDTYESTGGNKYFNTDIEHKVG